MNLGLGACQPLPDHGSAANGRKTSLPVGTVTFAFTDIEGSTQLLRRLGDRYGDVLTRHRTIVRRAFGAEGGIEIDRQGDAFFFAFPRARNAVFAAVEVQRAHSLTAWPESARVRVRIGLHTGEPTVGSEGYLGLDVVKAARLCKLAPGGHTLLSETTRALVRSTLPKGVTVSPHGEQRLKDIDAPEVVYELAIESAEPHAAIPPGWERAIEEHFGRVGVSIATRIGEHVAGSKPASGQNLEELAGRAVGSLEGKLRSGASAAFRAAHLSRES
jgi:class 3 adenylate cyclase